MGKSTKLKFDRDSNLNVKYVCVTKKMIGDGYQESEIGSLVYKPTGEVILKGEGFEYSIGAVDELDLVISPLDSMFSKLTFKIKKTDDSTATLPHKFYGIRETNLMINFDNEIGDSDEISDE